MQDISVLIASLPHMDKRALCALWQERFKQPAPPLRKDLLMRVVAYRLQEQAFGGLRAATRQRLRTLARTFERDSRAPIPSAPIAKPGTRLIRVWKGQTHVVTVADSGFEYEGRRHKSLSQIARLITGTRWSGPLFFGLKSQSLMEPPDGR